MYYTVSSALLLDDDHVSDNSPAVSVDDLAEINVGNLRLGRKHDEIRVVERRYRIHGKHLLSHVVVQLKFSRTMEKYGFSCSVDAFRMAVDVFSLAGKEMKVYALLLDIVCFYNKSNSNAFDLFSISLDSPKDAARSFIVFDSLIKVFAENSILEKMIYCIWASWENLAGIE